MGFDGSVDAKLFVYQDLGSRYPLILSFLTTEKRKRYVQNLSILSNFSQILCQLENYIASPDYVLYGRKG